MNDFKEMLKYLRLREGLSQSELAEKLSISKSAISMYEAGNRQPDIDTLEQIADLFNVDMNFLLGRETDHYNDPEVAELADMLHKNPEFKILFDASKKMSKNDMLFVIDMINRMKGSE